MKGLTPTHKFIIEVSIVACDIMQSNVYNHKTITT